MKTINDQKDFLAELRELLMNYNAVIDSVGSTVEATVVGLVIVCETKK